jgi:hypothetical protein
MISSWITALVEKVSNILAKLWVWYFRMQLAKLADEVCEDAKLGLG